jgi:hypothetical protein
MAHACRIAAADRALLEVTLENVTARESVSAEYTHVRAVASVSKKMTLQMLCVQVRLGAMRAWEFAISVLDWDDRVLGSSTGGWCGRATRRAGQDTSASLRPNNMGGRFAFGYHRGLLLLLLHHLTTRPVR